MIGVLEFSKVAIDTSGPCLGKAAMTFRKYYGMIQNQTHLIN